MVTSTTMYADGHRGASSSRTVGPDFETQVLLAWAAGRASPRLLSEDGGSCRGARKAHREWDTAVRTNLRRLVEQES
jgi:hypothetical protein